MEIFSSAAAKSKSTRLFGLAEWRAHHHGNDNSDDNVSSADTKKNNNDNNVNSDRDILLLPFRIEEALVPGQSVAITLKHGRFMDLFHDAMDDHNNCILGMVLLDDDGIGSCPTTIVLCEIQDFQVDAGFRGKITIEVTLKAVSRASLRELTAWKPIMKGVCQELVDKTSNRDEYNRDTDYTAAASTTNSSSREVGAETDLLDNIQSTLDVLDKQPQFQQAYNQALCLGTTLKTDAVTSEDSMKPSRNSSIAALLENNVSLTVRDGLTAASWAVWAVADDQYESKSVLLPQALSSTCALERLQLGLKVLLEERFQRAEQAGLSGEPEEAVPSTSSGTTSDGGNDGGYEGAFE